MAWEGIGRRRVWAALLVACLLALTASLARAADRPVGEWVGLASGKVGSYQWSVKARRGGGAAVDRSSLPRPCLLVGASWPVGRYSYGRVKARQCSTGSGRLSAGGPPVIASGPQPGRGYPAKVTAVGMLVAPAARRVVVTLANGNEKTIPLQRLNGARAGEAGLREFRYAAFVVRGSWCPERLVTETAAGRALWDSGEDGYACSG